MAKAISQKDYLFYKGLAQKVYSQKVRALKRWYDTYEEYYTGERELLYRQYLSEVHEEFNRTMDNLQLMLLGIYEYEKV